MQSNRDSLRTIRIDRHALMILVFFCGMITNAFASLQFIGPNHDSVSTVLIDSAGHIVTASWSGSVSTVYYGKPNDWIVLTTSSMPIEDYYVMPGGIHFAIVSRYNQIPDRSLLRSNDHGLTFTTLTLDADQLAFKNSRLFATRNDPYLYYSDDMGSTWSSSLVSTLGAKIHHPEIKGDLVFASEGNIRSLYRSNNNGISWEPAFLGQVNNYHVLFGQVLMWFRDSMGGPAYLYVSDDGYSISTTEVLPFSDPWFQVAEYKNSIIVASSFKGFIADKNRLAWQDLGFDATFPYINDIAVLENCLLVATSNGLYSLQLPNSVNSYTCYE